VDQQLDLLRGAVMIAYPAYHRLPSFDPARIELEAKEEPDGQSEHHVKFGQFFFRILSNFF
jgi:hypothetical protein